MLEISRYSMNHRHTALRRQGGNFSRVAIFSLRQTNSVEIENQFRCTPLDVLFRYWTLPWTNPRRTGVQEMGIMHEIADRPKNLTMLMSR
jgi:hypothetical protein